MVQYFSGMTVRTWLLGLALVVTAVGLGLWLFDPAPRLWVPGTYTATSLDGVGTTVLRLAPDGSAVWEDFPRDASASTVRPASRWRLSGRVLILESGSAAAAPVDFLQSLFERYDTPIMMPEVCKVRVVSADRSGLILDLGGVRWVLRRKEAAPG
jgi:hypothetical protein